MDVHVKEMHVEVSWEEHTLEIDGRFYVHTSMGEGEVLAAHAKSGYRGWIVSESECRWTRSKASVEAAQHEYAALIELI